MERLKIQFKELPESLQDDLRDAPIHSGQQNKLLRLPIDFQDQNYIAEIPITGSEEQVIFNSFNLEDSIVHLTELKTSI